MGWPKCNATEEYEQIAEKPLYHSLTFYHLGLILSALFGLISVVLSLYLMWRHATHYLKPWEQRHIIRVLFMVPIYSLVSFLSYVYYRHAIYFETLRDCYEAFAIASFFALMCHYLAPDLHSQKDFFRTLNPRPWVFAGLLTKCFKERRSWRTPRSGLTWFNIIWIGIFQYCFIRVLFTIVAVITQAFGVYCQESSNPAFAHIWVEVFEALGVTVAMYCLVQFYIQLRKDLAEHKPGLKILAIKLVIFFSFWQTFIISLLTSSNLIKSTSHLSLPDIKIGIPSLLLCMEMALFSVLHLFAFPWKPYDVKRSEIVASESMPDFRPDPKSSYQGGPFGLYAYLDAFNPWDLVKAVGRSFRWLFVGRKIREQDSSYKSHLGGTGLDGAQGSNIPINHPYSGGKKYQPLTEEEDNERLLSHAQSNPSDNAYFPPSVDANPASGDIGAMGGRYTDPYSRQAAPDSLQAFHPTPGTLRRTENNGQESGVLAGEEDTAYHGATTQPPQYHIPPDPTLGRLGREGSWDVWGGMAGGDGKAGGGRGQFQEGQAF